MASHRYAGPNLVLFTLSFLISYVIRWRGKEGVGFYFARVIFPGQVTDHAELGLASRSFSSVPFFLLATNRRRGTAAVAFPYVPIETSVFLLLTQFSNCLISHLSHPPSPRAS